MLLPRGKVLRFIGHTAVAEADVAERDLGDRCERVSKNEVRITVPVPLYFGAVPDSRFTIHDFSQRNAIT